MKREISDFLAYIGTERGLSPKTVSAYAYDLSKFGEFADNELGTGGDIGDIDQYVVKAYMRFLADKGYRKPNSSVARGRKLATLKAFFKFLMGEKRIKVNPVSEIKMPKVQNKEPSYLTEQEYKRLLRTIKKTATGYFRERDMAIVSMLLGMGLRLSELVELDVGCVNFDDGTVIVTRKGNHERVLPANDDVMIAIKRYLKRRKDVNATSPLFLSKRNSRIANASVWYLVKKYMKQTRIEKDKLSPHTLRHTFATILLKQGENILTIKELLSHRNLRTTERYLHIDNKDLKEAVGKIDLRVR
ncbi:MAG: tyrosine-type recombinase/integrase [Candidatus Aadella gelida]|nr:tyrosine-type recombinase/integrase [Candidatus Aadella gelida]